MSVFDIIGVTCVTIKCALQLAIAIRDSDAINFDFKQSAIRMTKDLKIVEDTLDQLQYFAQRATVHDEAFLLKSIKSLNLVIDDAHNALKNLARDRNFFERLLMKKDDYQNKFRDVSLQLHELCRIIEGTTPTMTRIKILSEQFPDFRKKFCNVPDKIFSFYNFSFIKNTSNITVPITIEKLDKTKFPFYMKADNEQIILSHQLRTWSAVIPKSIILDERVRRFRETRRNKNNPDKHGSSLKLNSNSSTDSLSKLTTPKLQPPTAVATTNIHRTLDFSEFSMSHDDLCGMALTQSFIYLATKYEVRVVSLEKKAIIAQYGTEGNGPNQFKHISYLYIPHNDETNLYIVDRGQYCVQQYKIDSNGLCFEYVQQYVVIANVSERYNLVSCVIFNQNLYVSDDANYCLHRFRLNAARQSFYFVDNSVNPISPGSLCVHDKYLYVAVRSLATLSIVVFNEQCEIVDWFRNPMIQEILAMDISSDDNELYILTTTQDENDNKKKRLAIISMDLVVGPQK